jgi:hypothetical protein
MAIVVVFGGFCLFNEKECNSFPYWQYLQGLL